MSEDKGVLSLNLDLSQAGNGCRRVFLVCNDDSEYAGLCFGGWWGWNLPAASLTSTYDLHCQPIEASTVCIGSGRTEASGSKDLRGS